ncbi:MAG: protease complex subunit PrcB family protein [bacterium]
MKRFSIAVFLTLSLVSCSSSTSPATPERTTPQQTGQTTSFRVLVEAASLSGLERKEQLVINDQAALDAFWKKAYPEEEQRPPTPSVDFSGELVLAVSQGMQSTGGYSVTIAEVKESDTALTVFVKETSPGKSCAVTQAFTYPLFIVAVPKTNKPISFSTVSDTTNCAR